jgi:hypothetical protein
MLQNKKRYTEHKFAFYWGQRRFSLRVLIRLLFVCFLQIFEIGARDGVPLNGAERVEFVLHPSRVGRHRICGRAVGRGGRVARALGFIGGRSGQEGDGECSCRNQHVHVFAKHQRLQIVQSGCHEGKDRAIRCVVAGEEGEADYADDASQPVGLDKEDEVAQQQASCRLEFGCSQALDEEVRHASHDKHVRNSRHHLWSFQRGTRVRRAYGSDEEVRI